MAQLTVGGIISNSIKLFLENALSLIGSIVLWLITIWIPYINLGTTIAVVGHLPIALSNRKIITPLEIFSSKYRRKIADVLLLGGLFIMGTMYGFMFFIIPAYVIMIAWVLSFPLLLDKDINPIEAMRLSNKLTFGKKWTIFLGGFVLFLLVSIPTIILYAIFDYISPVLSALFMFIGYIILFSISVTTIGYIYGELTKENN